MVDTSQILLGIEELDRDHAELVHLIQRLDVAIRSDQDQEVRDEALDALVEYMDRHFGAESRLMSDHGYPAEQIRLHEAEHAYLLNRVKRWQQERKGADAGRRLTFDIAAFLSAWVYHHVEGLDVKLARFLKSRGLT